MEVSIGQMFHFSVHNNTVLENQISFQFISKLSITKEAIYTKDLEALLKINSVITCS